VDDFHLSVDQSLDIVLIVRPDTPRFTVIAATRLMHLVTNTTPETSYGCGLFEVLGAPPKDSCPVQSSGLKASLERVIATRRPDAMATRKEEIRRPDGVRAARYWSAENLPVLSANGDLLYIVHRVEEVTERLRSLGVEEIAQATPKEPPSSRPPSPSVLLVEDSVMNQKLAKAVLARLGFTPDVVSNGSDAIAALEAKAYDFILMDVRMPVMDGVAATRAIRSRRDELHQPYIVAMTGSADDDDRRACLEAGMNGYLSKPFDHRQLDAILREKAPRTTEDRLDHESKPKDRREK
jgi:CheY-like chemotaxis protein